MVALYAELPYLVTLSAHEFNRGMTMRIKEIQRICMGCPAISLKAAKEFSMTPYGQISILEQGINWRIGRAISQMIKPTIPWMPVNFCGSKSSKSSMYFSSMTYPAEPKS
jgi:hypothetical protein